MGIGQKIAQFLGVSPPHYTEEEMQQYLDGFRTGYPLTGQPDYPVYDSKPYRRGLRYGRKALKNAGYETVQYEALEEE